MVTIRVTAVTRTLKPTWCNPAHYGTDSAPRHVIYWSDECFGGCVTPARQPLPLFVRFFGRASFENPSCSTANRTIG